MNETNEHNPDGLTPEQYGAPEWRLLRVGEVANEDDEFRNIRGEWHGVAAGWLVDAYSTTYRRRVSPTPAEQAQRRAENPVIDLIVLRQRDRIAQLEAGEQILWNQLAERDEVNAQLRAELERRVEEAERERAKLNIAMSALESISVFEENMHGEGPAIEALAKIYKL